MSANAHEELLCVRCRARMYSVCYVRLLGKKVQIGKKMFGLEVCPKLFTSGKGVRARHFKLMMQVPHGMRGRAKM